MIIFCPADQNKLQKNQKEAISQKVCEIASGCGQQTEQVFKQSIGQGITKIVWAI